MTFGENLANLRKRKGISQEQLAEALRLTRQTISKWELNQSTPDLQYLIQLSEYFEVTIDYLAKGEEVPSGAGEKYESQKEMQPTCEQRVDKTSLYKWSIILGLVLVIMSSLLMLALAFCAIFKPHEFWIDDRVYTGLAGFLRGTDSQGFFMLLNLLFIYGGGTIGWGLYGLWKINADLRVEASEVTKKTV